VLTWKMVLKSCNFTTSLTGGENEIRQATDKVTMRHVRVTIVAVDKPVLHILSVCLYSCRSYPAYKAQAPY
jgi:hypothetical protein